MKIIKNTSMQGLSLPFGTPEGPKTIFLAPKGQAEIPNAWSCRVAENLVSRRMVKMLIVEDPQTPAPQIRKPAKKIKK